MSKKLKTKKKKISVTRFEKKFIKAISYRIQQLTNALKFYHGKDFNEMSNDFRSRVDELESLKEYMK